MVDLVRELGAAVLLACGIAGIAIAAGLEVRARLGEKTDRHSLREEGGHDGDGGGEP